MSVTVRSSSSSDTVMCDAGEVAVGGGGGSRPATSGPVQYVRWSHPVPTSGAPTGWTASPTPVFVICASF